ncbi:hypothetical protein [Caulobacter sp.]|uniref:hypothetical protein n=1 Tax=Caulobacter sp. TaxID=78 RepID=UPI001B1EF3EC|nr:hypothetical protein [Caulobacter sp.]MBO9545531.1 hypothetical protein [Caulobacter sp.]
MIILAVAVIALAGPPAGAIPLVRAVSPAVGAEIAAGKIQIKVTFDQPMRASWSFVMRDPASYPDCAKTPVQSADGRTFTLDCTVEAGKDYWIGFNSERFKGFQSLDGVAAKPAMVRFSAH